MVVDDPRYPRLGVVHSVKIRPVYYSSSGHGKNDFEYFSRFVVIMK